MFCGSANGACEISACRETRVQGESTLVLGNQSFDWQTYDAVTGDPSRRSEWRAQLGPSGGGGKVTEPILK
jgi:hypothetical protein